MDFKQLEYISAIAQEKNITKAADRLYLSRSALNYSLLKLEEEMGTPLFHRINNMMIPTFAGDIFLEGAQGILEISRRMRQRITEVANSSSGRLTIGIADGGLIELFSRVFAKFHDRNPQYRIELKTGSLNDLREKLTQGELNLLWSSYNGMGDTLEHIVLKESEVQLAVPEAMTQRSDFPGAGSYLELSRFKEQRFVLQQKGSVLREIADEYFAKAGFEPQVLLEVDTLQTAARIGQSTGYPYFAPKETSSGTGEGVVLYPTGTRRRYYEALSYRRDTFFTAGDRELIELIRGSYVELG